MFKVDANLVIIHIIKLEYINHLTSTNYWNYAFEFFYPFFLCGKNEIFKNIVILFLKVGSSSLIKFLSHSLIHSPSKDKKGYKKRRAETEKNIEWQREIWHIEF